MSHRTFRWWKAAAFVLAGAWTLCTHEAAFAQAYPFKPVRIVVAQAPGGASDLLIRSIAQRLGDALGQQFIIDNRPGAGGNIGAEVAARAAPDGYTLFMVSAPHAIAPSLYRKLNYDLERDFAPVTLLGSEPLAVVIHPSLPVKSLRDFVAFLKKRPGEVSYGSTGNGAVNHLATELFKTRAGVDLVHIPYKGSQLAIPDVLTGVVPVLFANVSPLQPHIKSGRLRPLGVTSKARARTLPDVPTIAESGYPGYEAVNWFGLVAPARTPDEAIRRLNAALRDALAAPEIRGFYESRSAEVATSTPEEMRSFLRGEIAKWAEVVKASGARID
jgi:tripartite-type tricarboxylate transporter receptor subunit TctC